MSEISQELQISWCENKDEVLQAVTLFIENTSPDYISHGEVQSGRATGFSQWSPDLAAVLQREFCTSFEPTGNEGSFKLAIAYMNKRPAGILFVQLMQSAPKPYIIIQDLVIAMEFRNKGLGKKLLNWLEYNLKAMGIKLLFLESGINNHGAHAFFEANGFSVSSKIMVKELTPEKKHPGK